mgnify:CR=1 FL=1
MNRYAKLSLLLPGIVLAVLLVAGPLVATATLIHLPALLAVFAKHKSSTRTKKSWNTNS